MLDLVTCNPNDGLRINLIFVKVSKQDDIDIIKKQIANRENNSHATQNGDICVQLVFGEDVVLKDIFKQRSKAKEGKGKKC